MAHKQLPLPQDTSHHYRSLRLARKVALWSDTLVGFRAFGHDFRFGFDPLVGLLLPEVGDIISAISLAPALWISAVKMRSFPLTIALLYNALLDMVMGALPFLIGDILDFRSKSNVANYRLIVGYLDNDPKIRRRVKGKVVQCTLAVIALLALLVAVVYLAAKLTIWVWSFISNL